MLLFRTPVNDVLKIDEELKTLLPQTMRSAPVSGNNSDLQKTDEHVLMKTGLGECGLDETVFDEIPTFPELHAPLKDVEEYPERHDKIHNPRQYADKNVNGNSNAECEEHGVQTGDVDDKTSSGPESKHEEAKEGDHENNGTCAHFHFKLIECAATSLDVHLPSNNVQNENARFKPVHKSP